MAQDYKRLARIFAQRAGIDPGIFSAQINQESGFNPGAVSPAGAIGIAQIMPDTAKGWGVDPRDPVAALRAAAQNDAKYIKQYGGWRNALIAYNAGPGAVGSKDLPAETQNYINTILGGHNAAAASSGVSGGGFTLPPMASTSTAPQGPNKLQQMLSLFSQMDKTVGLDGGNTWNLLAQRAGEQSPAMQSHGVGMASAPPMGGITSPQGGYKVSNFEGTPVAAWMVPALQFARQHGWSGQLTSGVRTRAEQAYLYSHPQGYPVAKPGESEHEIENGGAFDATQAQQLWDILKRYPGQRPIWAPSVGLDDAVHFSLNGH